MVWNGFLTRLFVFSSSPGLMSEMVSFYLGCSFGFEGKLKEAGIPVRNVEQGRNVSMYRVSLSLETHNRKTQLLQHFGEKMHIITLLWPPLFCL